jgi:hypothetical protein
MAAKARKSSASRSCLRAAAACSLVRAAWSCCGYPAAWMTKASASASALVSAIRTPLGAGPGPAVRRQRAADRRGAHSR